MKRKSLDAITAFFPYSLPMRIVLFGRSAFAHWMIAPAAARAENRLSFRALKDCMPSRHSVDYVTAKLPYLPLPLHVMTPFKAKSPVSEALVHVCVRSVADKPFVKIADGILASSPELCFVQLAQSLSLPELVHAGNALCGTFSIASDQALSLKSRIPLTNVSRIAAFLRKNPGLFGAKAARRALRWVRDGFASPPESFMWLVLGLAHRDGGYALDHLKVNEQLKISRKAVAIAGRSALIPDLCDTRVRLSIEYDSNAEHLSARQMTRDATKRLALEADGYKVITVTARQLGSIQEMRSVAKEATRCLGLRFRVQSDQFAARHRDLFAMGWNLDAYFRAEWLRPHSAKQGAWSEEEVFALQGVRAPSKSRVS